MNHPSLYSCLFELRSCADGILPLTTGSFVHGFFHFLVGASDSELGSHLHHGPIPRPFTLSPLVGGVVQGTHLFVSRATRCYIRLTLLNGRDIWDRLQAYVFENGPIVCRLGTAEFSLTRLISTPSPHYPLWVGCTDWEHLATLPSQHHITFSFQAPTTFSKGERQFTLFPEPLRVWDSLLRVWNSYAPEHLHLEKERVRQALVNQEVVVTHCDLQTQTLHYSHFLQKGFLGSCSYHIQSDDERVASDLTALAALAPYAGLGYKTTMGMGQVHTTFSFKDVSPSSLREEEVQQ